MGNFLGLSRPFKSIGNRRWSGRCSVAVAFVAKGFIQSPITPCSRRDHSVCRASANSILKIYGRRRCGLSAANGAVGLHSAGEVCCLRLFCLSLKLPTTWTWTSVAAGFRRVWILPTDLAAVCCIRSAVCVCLCLNDKFRNEITFDVDICQGDSPWLWSMIVNLNEVKFTVRRGKDLQERKHFPLCMHVAMRANGDLNFKP